LTPMDFLLNLLLLVLGSLISAMLLAVLGFFTIKRLVGKAMDSKEVRDLKEALDTVAKELGRLKEQFDKLFNTKGGDYIT